MLGLKRIDRLSAAMEQCEDNTPRYLVISQDHSKVNEVLSLDLRRIRGAKQYDGTTYLPAHFLVELHWKWTGTLQAAVTVMTITHPMSMHKLCAVLHDGMLSFHMPTQVDSICLVSDQFRELWPTGLESFIATIVSAEQFLAERYSGVISPEITNMITLWDMIGKGPDCSAHMAQPWFECIGTYPG